MKEFFMQGLKYWGYPNKWLFLESIAVIGLFTCLVLTFFFYFIGRTAHSLSGAIFMVIYIMMFFIAEKKGMKDAKKKNEIIN